MTQIVLSFSRILIRLHTNNPDTSIGLGIYSSHTSPQGIQPHVSSQSVAGKSALSRFRLTRRKANKPRNQLSNLITEEMQKEVHKVVKKVLDDNPQKPRQDNEPIVLGNFDIPQNVNLHKPGSSAPGGCTSVGRQSIQDVPGQIRSTTASIVNASDINTGKKQTDKIVHTHNSGFDKRSSQTLRRNNHSLVHLRSDNRTVNTNLEHTVRASGNTVTKSTSGLRQNVVGQQHASLPNRPVNRMPLAMLSGSDMYADPVISSSEQPADLGDPDCVIILSDSD